MHHQNLFIFYFCAAVLCCGVQACGTSNNPWTVQLPSATTPIHDSFTASISGNSSDGDYSITITGNAGKVSQDNRTTEVIVRDQIPFGGDLVLYSLIGTDVDSILMGWAYCENGELTSLFLEATDEISDFTNSTVTGTCDITTAETTVNLVSNSECVTVKQPAAVPTIDGGSELSLQNGTVGNVTLNGEDFNLIPFAIVDCHDCTTSSSNGWFEVHSVMTSKTSADVCLGIFYLDLTCTGQVDVAYVQCFLSNTTYESFNAGYDLSSVIKDPADEANATCKAKASVTSPASPKKSSAGPEFIISFSVLALSMAVGLIVLYF